MAIIIRSKQSKISDGGETGDLLVQVGIESFLAPRFQTVSMNQLEAWLNPENTSPTMIPRKQTVTVGFDFFGEYEDGYWGPVDQMYEYGELRS